ncbi:MAG: hypothetical protein V1824_03125, partial [archaeon]
KILELYTPLSGVLDSVTKDLKELEDIHNREGHLDPFIENEIKQRNLIALYKKMLFVVTNLRQEIDSYYKEFSLGDEFLEEFRASRTYVFETSKKSQEFLQKIVDTFNIDIFTLKFNVVGTVDLNDIAKRVEGSKIGIDISVPASKLNLIYEEVLKTKAAKFRLISESIIIHFEKDNVLQIEGPSKKIKICDINATSFGANGLD